MPSEPVKLDEAGLEAAQEAYAKSSQYRDPWVIRLSDVVMRRVLTAYLDHTGLVAVADEREALTDALARQTRAAGEATKAAVLLGDRVKELEAGLRPFAERIVDIGESETDQDHFSNSRTPYCWSRPVTVGDIRVAARLLAPGAKS